MREFLSTNETLSPASRSSLQKKKRDASISRDLLSPPCFDEFKLPSVTGLPSSRQAEFEKPLYKRAMQTRQILLPLLASRTLRSSDPDLANEIVDLLCEQLSDDLKAINYKRVIAVTPDPLVRKAMSLAPESAFLDQDVIDIVKSSKKLADSYRQSKKSSRRLKKSVPFSPSPSAPAPSHSLPQTSYSSEPKPKNDTTPSRPSPPDKPRKGRQN